MCRLDELKTAALFSTMRVQRMNGRGARMDACLVLGKAKCVRICETGRMKVVALCACLRGALLCAYLTLKGCLVAGKHIND